MRKHAIGTIACAILLLLAAPPRLASGQVQIDDSSPFVYPKYSKRISMDFQDAYLIDVLKIFSQQTQLNLIAAAELADKRVTLYLDDVPVEQALQQLLRANRLTYELQPESNIYIVKPLSEPDEEVITRVYPLKHALVGGSQLQKTITIKTTSEEGGGATSSTEIKAGITDAVEAILTDKGRIIEDPRTNSIVVTDISNNFVNIEQTISRLDVAEPLILIEVEMLEISKTLADKIGVKFGESPLVLSGAQRPHNFPFGSSTNGSFAPATGYDFPSPETDEFTQGSFDMSGLTATVQFLKSHTDAKSLARPRILTLNNQTAQIRISTNEAIGTVENQSTDTGNTTSVEAERVETGVILTVTPQANEDTGEITMAVAPRVIVARTGATFEGRTFKDPEERGSQSILRVNDGDTIIIGGLVREEDTKTTTKVPFLGDLPLIGQAFRHTDNSVQDRELIIFITPMIVRERPALARTNPALRRLVREQDSPDERLQQVESELLRFDYPKN